MMNSIKISEQDGLSWLLALKNKAIDSNRNRINYEKYKGFPSLYKSESRI